MRQIQPKFSVAQKCKKKRAKDEPGELDRKTFSYGSNWVDQKLILHSNNDCMKQQITYNKLHFYTNH